jgi:hypothetical protein
MQSLALAEVLCRLVALRAESMFVEADTYRNTARGLYESLGFSSEQDVFVFRKDYL